MSFELSINPDGTPKQTCQTVKPFVPGKSLLFPEGLPKIEHCQTDCTGPDTWTEPYTGRRTARFATQTVTMCPITGQKDIVPNKDPNKPKLRDRSKIVGAFIDICHAVTDDEEAMRNHSIHKRNL